MTGTVIDASEELVLKDEISGTDESDNSSVQILDDNDFNNKNGNIDSFMVDIDTVEEEAKNSAYHRDEEGSSSSSRFTFAHVISHHTPVPKESKRSGDGITRRNSGKSCFNCGVIGHELSSCPEPRDSRRISQNRNSFGRRRESGGVRFHEQCQGPQPGVVSEALRDALRIGVCELPPWIYRMRKLGLLNGYPPAYRNRATERLTVKFHMEEDVASTIGRRRKRKHAEAAGEDDQFQIKPEKLVRFPGFNFDDANNMVDLDTQQWLVPPWETFVQAQQHHFDQRRPPSAGTAIDYAVDDDGPTVNKRSKISAAAPMVNSGGGRAVQSALVVEEEMVDSTQQDDDGGGDGNVLFVDASRTKSRKKAADVSLEEGEIVDESDQEITSQDTHNHTERKIENAVDEVNKLLIPAMQLGTPVPLSHHVCGDKLDHEVEKPVLENWSLEASDRQSDIYFADSDFGRERKLKIFQVLLHNPLKVQAVYCIQAFQHQPPGASTGFFKRMHEIVKGVRKQKKNEKEN